MHDSLIGDVLCRMGIIDRADIDLVLIHQERTRQRFGQIAIRLGMATQEQVWEAWARQLAERERIELEEIGSDTPALETLPLATARRLGIVPLRLWGKHLVVAAPAELPEDLLYQLSAETGCYIHVCASDPASIHEHLERLSDATCAA